MKARITNVRVICTAPEGINLTVVRIDTDQDGLYGLGDATLAYRWQAVAHYVETYLKPLLVGRDAAKITELWQLMHQNAYWRFGPVENCAISGIDMALWDIKGKQAGMPVYELLGGKVREGVPVYRHVEGKDIYELIDRIEAYRDQGITHLRVQCGGYGGTAFGKAPAGAPENAEDGIYIQSGPYIRHTVKMFEELRTRLGEDLEFIHDVHERIAPSDAVRLARELEPFHLFYLEDPIPIEQTGWFERLRSQTVTPLAEGELFNHPAEYQGLIENRLIDFIRVHISEIGGITPAWKLTQFASVYGVRTAWHGPGDMSPIAHAANIHIDLAAQNFGIQEWSGTNPPNGVIQKLSGPEGALIDVFHGMPELRNGYVYASEAPGLGVEIDEKEAAKYPCNDDVTTWTMTRNMDGALITP